MKFFEASYKLAQAAHSDQFRRYGKPYVTHIDGVINIFKTKWETGGFRPIDFPRYYLENKEILFELLLSICNFHDCRWEDNEKWFNDHPEVLEELSKLAPSPKFYRDFNDAVRAISKYPKGVEEYERYIIRVNGNPFAKLIKICDLSHNLSDLKPGNLRDKYRLTLWFLNNY